MVAAAAAARGNGGGGLDSLNYGRRIFSPDKTDEIDTWVSGGLSKGKGGLSNKKIVLF